MKLSAPPPPPPEPGPESTPDPVPAAGDAPLFPEPSVPAEQPPAKSATWPTWFGTADLVLVFLTLALAFLVASFAARNSDIWLHLASGQRLATGEYQLGSDPFSYTAADRTWVNHSWLFDLGAFLLYRGEGFVLVLVKALTVAGAIGLVFTLRRAGQSLWPWAIFATLAVLASAPLLTLRPQIGSVFFLALTLLLVFRMPSRPGSWRLPIAIGVTFCLWSNIDGWFLLGPATLLLLLAGEFARQKLGANEPAGADSGGHDPLAPLPDLATLVRATAIGIVACMVNPHHIGVWELPFELVGAAGAETDPRIGVLFTHPFQARFWRNEGIASNVGGIAYAILLFAGLYAAFLSGAVGRLIGPAADVDPLPLPHALVWVGFAALSLLTFFAMPFFALVTIPLVASRWNLFSERLVLQSGTDRRTRLLLTGSVGGRIFSLIALIALGIAAWPGWLQPPASAWWESGLTHPANARRVEWKVEADPEFQRSAEWLQSARQSGRLPAESRGIVASVDLANYCAWFAPLEKVFANGRFKHHRAELPEFAKARRGLGLYLERAEPPDPREAEEVLKRWNAVYVAVALQSTATNLDRVSFSGLTLREMWLNWTNWSPWYLNGRTSIAGWRATPQSTDPTFDRLELRPEALAYGGDVKPLPPVKTEPPLLVQGAWDELLRARRTTPPGAEEAMAWLAYKDRSRAMNFLAQQSAALLRLNVPGIATPALAPALFEVRDEMFAVQGQLGKPPPQDGRFMTFPILAVRAARRGIAENPDHPDGYFALAQALADRDLQIAEADRTIAQVTALHQCLIRMPAPAEYRRAFFLSSPTSVARTLVRLYLGQRYRTGDFQGERVDSGSIGELAGGGLLYQVPAGPATGGRPAVVRVQIQQQLPAGSTQLATGLYILPLDLARQMLTTAEQYANVEIADPDERANYLKELVEERKVIDASYQRALDLYRTRAERAPRLRERHGQAMGVGLIGDALARLKEADLAKEFGEASTDIALHMIAVELAVGRLEDAAADLAAMREELGKLADQPGANSQRIQGTRRRLAELEFQKLVLEGNYGEAGKEYEALAGGAVGKFPPLADLTRSDMKGFDPANVDERPYLIFGAGWPAFGMFASLDTPFGLLPRFHAGYIQLFRHSVAQEVVNRMREDSEFFFRRGYLSLLEGDIAGAKKRFQSCTRPPPEGWKIPHMTHRTAEIFLRQIEAAEKFPRP